MPFDPFTAGETDPDKPVLASWGEQVMNNLDYLNGLIGGIDGHDVYNGSFELDSDSDGIPDGWTRALYSGGSSALITSPTAGHGAKSFQFTQPSGASQGGGDLLSDYIPVHDLTVSHQRIAFQVSNSNGTIVSKVKIKCYDAAKAANGSDLTIYDSSTSVDGTPALGSYQIRFFNPNSGTKFIRIQLVGGEVGPNTSATVTFDNVTLHPSIPWLSLVSSTLSEATTTNTGFTDVGDLTLGLPHEIDGTNMLLVVPLEVKHSSPTGNTSVRIKIGSATSNEVTVLGDVYRYVVLFLEFDPVGTNNHTIDVEIHNGGSGTAYVRKSFGLMACLVEDPS